MFYYTFISKIFISLFLLSLIVCNFAVARQSGTGYKYTEFVLPDYQVWENIGYNEAIIKWFQDDSNTNYDYIINLTYKNATYRYIFSGDVITSDTKIAEFTITDELCNIPIGVLSLKTLISNDNSEYSYLYERAFLNLQKNGEIIQIEDTYSSKVVGGLTPVSILKDHINYKCSNGFIVITK